MSFKPYKGVSSNEKIVLMPRLPSKRFKPYKGVSSNLENKALPLVVECFKPYKGVSSNWKRWLKHYLYYGFKPYKGVSSNLLKDVNLTSKKQFQTL